MTLREGQQYIHGFWHVEMPNNKGNISYFLWRDANEEPAHNGTFKWNMTLRIRVYVDEKVFNSSDIKKEVTQWRRTTEEDAARETHNAAKDMAINLKAAPPFFLEVKGGPKDFIKKAAESKYEYFNMASVKIDEPKT